MSCGEADALRWRYHELLLAPARKLGLCNTAIHMTQHLLFSFRTPDGRRKSVNLWMGDFGLCSAVTATG